MSTMICNNCGQYGIYWKNLTGIHPFTYCPNCGGTNCQRLPPPELIEEEIDEEEEN